MTFPASRPNPRAPRPISPTSTSCGVNGPNALNGIKTLSITPSYSYNSKNSFHESDRRQEHFLLHQGRGQRAGRQCQHRFSPRSTGSIITPARAGTRTCWRSTLLATTVTGYGGKVAPPFTRSFIGGENDVRGFDFFSITPIAFIPSSATINQLNPDGSQRMQNVIVNGVMTPVTVTLPIPTYQIITPGGDTHAVFNFEYRIPIVGPVTLVPFFDAGINRILYKNQLTVNPGQIANLDNQFPQAAFTNKVKIAPGTQDHAHVDRSGNRCHPADRAGPVPDILCLQSDERARVSAAARSCSTAPRSRTPRHSRTRSRPTERRIPFSRSAERSGLPSAGLLKGGEVEFAKEFKREK